MQVVVAWAERTKLVPTGRQVMRDMNWRPEFTAELEGRAAMWSRRATEADVAKAGAYAANEGILVLTFPTSERDPLAKARAIAVQKRHERTR